jgi:adenylate cyclase
MAELWAEGEDGQQWRRPLSAHEVTLGRSTRSDWLVPWDRQISSVHAQLVWNGNRLLVRRVASARNPIFHNGQVADEFEAVPGEVFVIGKTRFAVMATAVDSDLPQPQTELSYSSDELRRYHYADADERIDALASLPALLRFAPTEQDMETRVVEVLLRGMPQAAAAAVVRLDEKDALEIRSLRLRRNGAEFRPSRRLVQQAHRRRQGVAHVWAGSDLHDFTYLPGWDWAVCSPMSDEPFPGWALYTSGEVIPAGPSEGTPKELLKGDLKFSELVAEMFGALRQMCYLERRQGQLSRFLSQPVLTALASQDVDAVLQPRKTTVTVLFCDLRGSCQIAEEGQDDLMATWNRVSEGLGLMSSCILDQDGVIGGFQGDAAMGFWGWPLSCDDQVERAMRAALAIRRRFGQYARQQGHPLFGFACGIGLAHGPAIAGRLGTRDQCKIDVFGPVVNRAARLESMTKELRVPILMDEECARALQVGSHPWLRLRRVARVRPMGMKQAVTVTELLPPAGELPPERERLDYEAALDAFLQGRWADCRSLLARHNPLDGAAGFLTAFLDTQRSGPPQEWDGVIALSSK